MSLYFLIVKYAGTSLTFKFVLARNRNLAIQFPTVFQFREPHSTPSRWEKTIYISQKPKLRRSITKIQLYQCSHHDNIFYYAKEKL
jgi:hypothetical protein